MITLFGKAKTKRKNDFILHINCAFICRLFYGLIHFFVTYYLVKISVVSKFFVETFVEIIVFVNFFWKFFL